MSDITILSCPICNYPKLREYGNGIYQCDFCETYFDKDENIVLTEQEWIQTCNTEQLAEWIAHQTMIALLENQNNHSLRMTYPAYWVEWLKQPHREEKQNDKL